MWLLHVRSVLLRCLRTVFYGDGLQLFILRRNCMHSVCISGYIEVSGRYLRRGGLVGSRLMLSIWGWDWQGLVGRLLRFVFTVTRTKHICTGGIWTSKCLILDGWTYVEFRFFGCPVILTTVGLTLSVLDLCFRIAFSLSNPGVKMKPVSALTFTLLAAFESACSSVILWLEIRCLRTFFRQA